MKASDAMHLPKDNERERLPSMAALDFDLEDLLGSINESPASVSPKKNLFVCPECQRRGVKSHIKSYQLNFHEAMYLCPNAKCTYPMKEDRLLENFTFKREASLAVEDDKKELYRQSPDSLGDIFNEFADPFFDSPMELSGRLGASCTNNSRADNPKTSLFEVSDIITSTSLNQNDNKYPLSLTAITQHDSSAEMDIDDPYTGPTSHLDLTKEFTRKNTTLTTQNDQDLSVPGDLCSSSHSETISLDKTPNSVTEDPDPESFNKPITVHPSVIFFSLMIQWRNENNSCWLDSILQVAVASDNVRAALSISGCTANNIWNDLINTYDRTQVALNDTLANSPETTSSTNSISVDLSNARQNFLGELQKSVKQLECGQFQSLLEMLPLSLKVDGRLENIFKAKLLYHFKCRNCHCQSARRSGGLILSMPNTFDNFHPLNARFKTPCRACKSENGSTTVSMEQLPPCIVFHFQNGLSDSNLRVLDFALCGQLYCVFAVVQYITDGANHFVTWIRDIKKDRWLRCDDLGEPICQWTRYQPKIPPCEIHMVFWERKHFINNGDSAENALEPIRNEEIISFAESIPTEHFLAHEEGTIVIPEDAGPSTTTCNDIQVGYNNTNNYVSIGTFHSVQSCSNTVCSQNQVFDTSQAEVADIETSTLTHTSGHNVAMHEPTVHNPGQNGRHDASSQAGPVSVSHPTAGFTHTTLHPVPQLGNGTMMTIPTDGGRQQIQIIAPPNACNIYIVSQGGQMGQPYYLVPATSVNSHQPSYPTLPSFVNNPHSYNMVAQGGGGPLQNQTEKPKGPLKRMRRQYKLSGYSKRVGPANRYSPMQASKSCSSIKSTDSICSVASVNSCNSKGDSETRSELSELSDILPDLETSGNARDCI